MPLKDLVPGEDGRGMQGGAADLRAQGKSIVSDS